MSLIARRYTNVAALGGLASPTSADSDVTLWIAAVYAAGGTVTQARADIFTTMAAGIKSDLAISTLNQSFDGIGCLAAESAPQAKIDFAARSTLTLGSTPTFTANKGYAGDGSAAYLDTGINALSATRFTQNDNSFGCWVQTSDSRAGTFRTYIGAEANANVRTAFSKNTTGQNNYCDNTLNASINYASTETGFFHVKRTASNAQAVFRNGASQATDATASSAQPSRTFILLASNDAAVDFFTDGTLAFWWVGASLNGQESAFYNRVHTALTAINSGLFP